MTGTDGQSVTHIRLVDTEQRIQIVLGRMRSIFTTVTASEPRPCDGQPGIVRVHVTVQL